jgi:hypothetical protein
VEVDADVLLVEDLEPIDEAFVEECGLELLPGNLAR